MDFLKKHGIIEIADAEEQEFRHAKPSSWEALIALIRTEKWLALVAGQYRPGVMQFSTTLEYTHYKPETPRNSLFKMFCCMFDDLPYFVFLTPWEDKALVTEHAAACGLRIANGIPLVISSEGSKFFPTGDHPHLFSLENLPDSPVYGSMPDQIEKLLEDERQLVNIYLERQHQKRKNS